jgi:WXG100 family type VII secretion target
MDMGIKVTPQQLQALSGRVSGAAGQIDSELSSLKATLAPLGTDWAGAAQSRFLALWNEWQTGAQKIQDALAGISMLLGQAGSAYADAEAQIAHTFATL